MKKILIKLLISGTIYFSSSAFAWQIYDCSCCDMTDIGPCAFAPEVVPHVKINFDFRKAGLNTKLYAIEKCGTPFEVSREKPYIDGFTNAGDLLLILCRKNQRLDSKKISISKNYYSSCAISNYITCEK